MFGSDVHRDCGCVVDAGAVRRVLRQIVECRRQTRGARRRLAGLNRRADGVYEALRSWGVCGCRMLRECDARQK